MQYYAGIGANLGASRVRDSLSLLEQAAENITAPGFLRSDGSWSDINYSEVPSGQWSPWEHFRRLQIMARAYNTQGQRFYRDPHLLGEIDAVLRYLPVFYGTEVSTPGNWWFWVIGPALDLGPTLMLMGDHLSPELLDQSTRILAARIGPAPGVSPTFSLLEGQNWAWSALNHYSLALLREDTDKLRRVRDSLTSLALPINGEDGVQTDASFHQHGRQLYTGGYGGSYGYEMGKYLLLTRGTPYSLNLESGTPPTFADFAVDGIAWSLYHNYFDVSVVGREIAKPWTNGFNGLATLLQMSEVPSPRQTQIARAARKMLETWTDALPIELAAAAARLEDSAIPAERPSGHRHYYISDYTIHRRPNYFASVKMLSKRTKSGERTNNENLLGSRQSDGRFHLVLRGNEYAATESWPAMDWSRLPGITLEQRAGAANSTYGMGLRSFVGGTGDGRNGVSAMDFAAIDSGLTAKKGWVFFDDAIVFLVSGVKSFSGNRIETVVDQRPLSSLTAPLWIESDSWIASDGIGYFFPGGERFVHRREIRSGAWSALGGPSQWPESQLPVSTIYIDHGSNLVGAAAEYVIVPGVDRGAMSAWVQSQPITVIQNNEAAGAVRDNRTGSVGVIFWSAGSVVGISTDSPAVLYQTTTGSRIELSLADPAQGTGNYRVTLPQRLALVSADPGVTITSGTRTTTIVVPRNGGRTVRVTLQQPGSGRSRGVRR